MKSASRILLAAPVAFAANFLSSQVAMAVTETDLLAQNDVPTSLPSETKVEKAQAAAAAAPMQVAQATEAAPAAQTAPASQTFMSDGRPVALENLGVTITPPAGWEVSTNTGTLSVVMREPHVEAPSYDKPKFQRNITVATVHTPAPIDEKRAIDLKAEMTKTFGADPLVSDFQIIEHKFFNYRGTNDGLLVYSSLKIGEYPMMQMHVLVSGQAKQFLLTYTDLAERFSDQTDGNFAKAWNSIVSIEVTGAAPHRYDAYMRYGAGLGGAFVFLFAIFLIRRRATRVDYNGEADAMIEEEAISASFAGDAPSSVFSTLAHGWNLGGDGGKTRQTEYVSNY